MTRIVVAAMARVWCRAVTAPKKAKIQKYLEGKNFKVNSQIREKGERSYFDHVWRWYLLLAFQIGCVFVACRLFFLLATSLFRKINFCFVDPQF